MITPERRTPLDFAVVLVIVIAVVVVGVIAYNTASEPKSDSSPAAAPAVPLTDAVTIPGGYRELWSSPSSATSGPVTVGNVVVTAEGDSVVGHDPHDGTTLWSYRRSLPVCSVTGVESSPPLVVATFRNDRGCSDVVELRADTGGRLGARTSDADKSVRLSGGGADFFLSQGDTRLETFSSSLVRGIEYGRVDAPVQPGTQPRVGCTLLSSAINQNRVAVVEKCPSEPGYRLTQLGASLDDDEKLIEHSSVIATASIDSPPPQVLSVSNVGAAIYYVGDQGGTPGRPSVITFGPQGDRLGTPKEVLGNPTGIPPGSFPQRSGGLVTFATGDATVVINPDSLDVRMQIPGAIGTGLVIGTQLLVPTPSGFAVFDAATFRMIRQIAYARGETKNQSVSLGLVGEQVVEQIGDRLSILGPA